MSLLRTGLAVAEMLILAELSLEPLLLLFCMAAWELFIWLLFCMTAWELFIWLKLLMLLKLLLPL